MQMFEEGSVAIVTGAGPGMGRAIALGFAAEGVDVVIAARRKERLDAVADDIRALGREPLVVTADLSERDDCHAVVEQAVERFGRLDHLVQNGHHAPRLNRTTPKPPVNALGSARVPPPTRARSRRGNLSPELSRVVMLLVLLRVRGRATSQRPLPSSPLMPATQNDRTSKT